jgi:hypothetical protein
LHKDDERRASLWHRSGRQGDWDGRERKIANKIGKRTLYTVRQPPYLLNFPSASLASHDFNFGFALGLATFLTAGFLAFLIAVALLGFGTAATDAKLFICIGW